jgi:hypothetical protein
MEQMVSKTFMKVIGFFGSLLLTLFAGMFGLISLSSLVVSIIEGDVLSVIIAVFAGCLAWAVWSIRKDTLV